MPIRPIDMQVLVPKSQEVSKINQDMFNRGEISLHQGLMEKKKEDEKKLKRVNKYERKETEKLLDEKSNINYNKNKKLKDGKGNHYGSTIDIKL